MIPPPASPGSMNVDWEERWNVDRLRTYRTTRAREALAASDVGAVLLFDFNNIRYVTSTHIGEWARDKMTRYALLTRGGDPHIWDFGSAAKHHRLNCPWLRPENIHAGMVGLRGAVAPDAGLFRAAAREIRDILRAEGVADMPIGVDIVEPPMLAALADEGITVRDGQQVMLDAREVKSIDEIMLLNTACAMVDGAYQLISRAAQAGRPRERARGQRHQVPVRPRLRARRQHQRGLGRALQPASARLLATGSSGPGDQAFFDIIQTFIGYKTCYYRTFVVGKANDAQRDAYKQAREWIDKLDRADAARRDHRPGRERLAEGGGVRVRQRDGVLRPPVRPQRRAVPARAADHQPAQLARAPGRAQGGHGHRARDLLPGQGRRVGRPDRGGGRRHGRRARRSSPASRPTSCSSPTRTEARRPPWRRRPPTSIARPGSGCTGRWSSAASSRCAPRSCSSRGWSGARRTSASARRRSRPASPRRCAPTTTRSAPTAATTTRSPGACRWRRSSPSCSAAGPGSSAARAARCT